MKINIFHTQKTNNAEDRRLRRTECTKGNI